MSKNSFHPPTSNFIVGLACLIFIIFEVVLSEIFFQEFSLLERNMRGMIWMGVWFGVIGASAARKPVLSVFLSAGNLIAIILGSLLGDFEMWFCLALYDPNSSSGPSPLVYSYGQKYWLCLVLLFTAIGAALQHKYTVDGYPAWMRKLNARMKRRIGKIWDALTRLFPG